MTGSPKRPDNEGHIQLPEASPAVAFNVDRHEVNQVQLPSAVAEICLAALSCGGYARVKSVL